LKCLQDVFIRIEEKQEKAFSIKHRKSFSIEKSILIQRIGWFEENVKFKIHENFLVS
jgi:hypothetical protein